MPPPVKKDKKSLLDLQQTEDAKPVVPQIIVIMGQNGSGKTTLAATAFIPDVNKRLMMTEQELEKAEVLTLPGAVWIEADEQGLVSLRAKKIRPQFILSLQTLVEERGGNFAAAIRDLHGYLGEAAQAGATTAVIDTVTSFGQQWLVRNYVDGNDNGFAGWQMVAQEQSKLLAACTDLKLRQIWLAQPSENKVEILAQSKQGTELDKAKALSQGVGGGTNYVVPSIAGRAFPPVLNAACSMSMWLRARRNPGKPTKRELLPYGGDGAQGKVRYEGIFPEKIEPDLWTMDRKIERVLGQG